MSSLLSLSFACSLPIHFPYILLFKNGGKGHRLREGWVLLAEGETV